jgi:hypothetical protein
VTRSGELATAEAELDAYEAELLASIHLGPEDGPIDAYLTDADVTVAHRLDVLRERVSKLRAAA